MDANGPRGRTGPPATGGRTGPPATGGRTGPPATGGRTGPPATGERLAWADAPAWLRAEVAARLGGEVVEAVTQPSGFSPGLAVRLRLADGRRAFVKAV